MANHKPIIICLTGQMASGKNYVSSLLENENCVSIDLDKTVHQAIKECKQQILDAFSSIAKSKNICLLNKDGNIDTKALGTILFKDASLLKQQETIVYPKVIAIAQDFIQKNISQGKNVIINATVLYKTPELLQQCDVIYYVKSSFIKRLRRAKKRDKSSIINILNRFKTQKHLLKAYQQTDKPILIIKN